MMKFFFWIAFAVFLAASIPHVAYFFASFEPTDGPAGLWWWAVSYAIAISIDVTVYLLSYTAFRRYRRYKTWTAVWQHWLLIVMCTMFSWVVNWAYAKQFHSPIMLSAAESTAPWLIHVFPFMASSFPLLGIVYTMMAETMEEDEEESKKASKLEQILNTSDLSKLRRALTTGRLNNANQVTAVTNAPVTRTTEELNVESKPEETAITGQFVTVEGEAEPVRNTSTLVGNSPEHNQDKLQMTIEALKVNPEMTDEALAEHLSLKRPASARFWRVKAIEILNTADQEPIAVNASTKNAWATTGALANVTEAKR